MVSQEPAGAAHLLPIVHAAGALKSGQELACDSRPRHLRGMVTFLL